MRLYVRDQGLLLPACVFFSLCLCLWVFLTVFPMECLLSRLISKYLFPSRLLPISACGSASLATSFPARVLQASELGMTSAFYKYILTTMVRTPSSPSGPHSLPWCLYQWGPAPGLTPLLGARTSPSCTWTGSWRTPPTSWASPCSTPRTPSTLSLCAASTCPGGRTVKPAPTQALR